MIMERQTNEVDYCESTFEKKIGSNEVSQQHLTRKQYCNKS